MIKILFICHGNICRSPMAEFVMKKLVADEGLSSHFEISSAATSREEIGNPVYPPVRKLLSQHGISCKGKTARQITESDYDYYDYLIPMEQYNIRNMCYIFPVDKDNKIHLLLDFTDTPRDVVDPWYTGNFTETWADVNKGCKALLEKIKAENFNI
ncbi:MAG: low molecular weight phosphotyrosine protein phosphatase [Clostridia bacterium]|nr:low molecular weight phosphotyrosine protein phosphatase [Clostridia bacterium]